MKRLLLCLSLVLSLLQWSPVMAGNSKNELTIGITQYPSTFNPLIDAMMAKSYILAMTRRPLTAYDQNWKLICMLCVTLPTIENGLAKPERTAKGQRGIAVTFKIRPEAQWGDGVPVTSKDVVFSWQVGRNKNSGVGNQEFYRSLYKIDMIDDKTFTLHFDKLTFSYNSMGGFELLPAHIEAVNFTDPVKYRYQTAYDTDIVNEGLYNGPYVISAVQTGSVVVLEQNPKWWGKKPAFKKITVRVISNTSAMEANILSGGLDMIAGELGLPLDQALSFEKRNGQKFNVVYKPGLIYEHIDLNLDNPVLSDIRVRQALMYGINRDIINSELFDGRQPTANTSVNPLDQVYAVDVLVYKYNPTKAIALLKQAGWKKIKNGIRYNSKGEKLTLTLMTTSGNRSRELIEQVLQNQWRAIGVDIRIKNEPARVFFGQTLTKRLFKGMAMYAWISSPENVPRTVLHSAHIPKKSNNYSGQNYTGYKNPEMDKVLEKIEVELDFIKRKKLWRKMQQMYARDLPVIPLYFRANAYILPRWLGDVEPTGQQDPTTLWVENWKHVGR